MSKLSLNQSEETPKKITLKELVERSDKIKNKKKETQELYVKSLDGTIIIQKPDRTLISEAWDMDEEDMGNAYIVYNSVISPNIKSEDLHKAYGIISPIDIVDEIFEPGEVEMLSRKIVEFAGYGNSVSIVEDVKN